MEQNMLCLGYLHDSKPILSFCLNSSCVISSLCCTVCLKERHQKHQEDIKNKDYVTELIQNFINEQTYIENELNGLNLNQEEVLKQILDFIGQIKISLTTSLQLIKDNKFEETNGGIIDIKYWYCQIYIFSFIRILILSIQSLSQTQYTLKFKIKDSNEQQKGLKAFKIKLDELQAQIFNCKGLQLKFEQQSQLPQWSSKSGGKHRNASILQSKQMIIIQKLFVKQVVAYNSILSFSLQLTNKNIRRHKYLLNKVYQSIQINPMSSYAWNVKGALLMQFH